MSTFTENWIECMHSNGFPAPIVEDVNEALEVADRIHQALENSGGVEVTIGFLVTVGALVGVDEAAVVAVADVAATVYLAACLSCMASVAFDDLKNLFASNDLPDYVVAELNSEGVDLAEAVA